MKSDSFGSYPQTVALSGNIHRTVNHSGGFVSEDGTHTNTIESVWAGLKLEIEKGVELCSLVYRSL